MLDQELSRMCMWYGLRFRGLELGVSLSHTHARAHTHTQHSQHLQLGQAAVQKPFLRLTHVAKGRVVLCIQQSAGTGAGPLPRQSEGASPPPIGATSTSLSTTDCLFARYRNACSAPHDLPMTAMSVLPAPPCFKDSSDAPPPRAQSPCAAAVLGDRAPV